MLREESGKVTNKICFSIPIVYVTEDIDNKVPEEIGYSMQAIQNCNLYLDSVFYTQEATGQAIIRISATDGLAMSNFWDFRIDATTSSDERLMGAIALYPLPFVNQINFVVPSELKVNSMEFYDVTGRRIHPVIEKNQQHYIIDFTGLSSEFILMNVISGHKTFTRKLIRKHRIF